MKNHRDFLAGMAIWNRSEGEQLTHTHTKEGAVSSRIAVFDVC